VTLLLLSSCSEEECLAIFFCFLDSTFSSVRCFGVAIIPSLEPQRGAISLPVLGHYEVLEAGHPTSLDSLG